MSSAVELGVPLLPGASEAAARFSNEAESAVRGRGEESVVWAALWVCAAVLGVLVPGVWVEFDWPGDGAVVVLPAVWGVASLDCSTSCEPDEFGVFPRLDATIDVVAVAVEDGMGPVASVGLATPAGVPATPRVDGGVGVDPAADEESGVPEDAVAGETAELAVAGEAVVVGRTSVPAEYAAGGEEVMAGEASPSASDAMVAVDAPVPAAGEVGGEVGSAPAAEEPGSEDESMPAAELEPGAPIEAGVSPDSGRAVVPASGVDISVADIAVPAVSMASAAAAGVVGEVAVAASGVGVEAPGSELGDVAIPQLATLVLTSLVPA